MRTRDNYYTNRYGRAIPINLTGARIGLRTVLEQRINNRGEHLYLCKCLCGRQGWYTRHVLLSGQSRSCASCTYFCKKDAERWGIQSPPKHQTSNTQHPNIKHPNIKHYQHE